MTLSHKFTHFLFVILLILSGVGCAGTKVTFQDNPPGEYDFRVSKGRLVQGSAAGFQLLLFIPIGINGRQARAYQQLQEAAPGCYLKDIMIQERWYYAYFGTVHVTEYFAMAYPPKDKQQASAQN
jgi:hypothetical protein